MLRVLSTRPTSAKSPHVTAGEIYRISPDGSYDLWVEDQGLNGASGNTFDKDGNLLQSSLRAGIIHRITPDGEVTEFVNDGLRSPVGIAATKDGAFLSPTAAIIPSSVSRLQVNRICFRTVNYSPVPMGSRLTILETFMSPTLVGVESLRSPLTGRRPNLQPCLEGATVIFYFMMVCYTSSLIALIRFTH